jgi:hypothetical protein
MPYPTDPLGVVHGLRAILILPPGRPFVERHGLVVDPLTQAMEPKLVEDLRQWMAHYVVDRPLDTLGKSPESTTSYHRTNAVFNMTVSS